MSTELIRVEPPRLSEDGVSQFEAAISAVKAKPYLALLAAPAILVAVPTTTVAVGAFLAAGAAGAHDARYRKGGRGPTGLTSLSHSDALGKVDVSGAPLRAGRVYARHPKASRADRLILAKDLHAVIVREQIAEIIKYMRSRLHLKSLKVSVRSTQSGRFFAGGTLQAVPLSARLTGRREEAYAVEWSSHKPVRMDDERELVWINDFPEIVAAAEDARHGAMKVSQSTNLSFDIEAQAAKLAKIDSGWLSDFEFIVEAEFE